MTIRSELRATLGRRGARSFGVATLTAGLVLQVAAPARADEPPGAAPDALDPLRERFRAGMDRYAAGAFAEAIVIWEGIYAELGAEKGYRLAFNIARAHDRLGANGAQAAELYETYVKEVRRRRGAGEALEPLVERQEAEANERLAELAATKGRIEVVSDGRPLAVRIDDGAIRLAGFVAYVTPDRVHVVTFRPGEKDEKRVSVTVPLGKIVSVSPPAADAAPPAPPPVVSYTSRAERPFGKEWIYVAAGATALSVVVPVLFRVKALDVKDEYDATPDEDVQKRVLEADYDTAKLNYYASIAIPSVLGAATLGLAAWWLWGAKEIRVPVQAGITPGGASVSSVVRF